MPTILKGMKRDDEGLIIPIADVFTESDIERFWRSMKGGENECWPWDGAMGSSGYGEFRICQKNVRYRYRAHRVAYELTYGFEDAQAREMLVIRHKCDNPKCCNPEHLTAGTHKDNVADRVERGRSAKGVNNGRSKLTPEAVKMARYCMDELGISHTTLARVTGMDPAAFKSIKERETWKDVA